MSKNITEQDLNDILGDLLNQFFHIDRKWIEFLLLRTEPATTNLLNEVAGSFFALWSDDRLDYIITSTCRLLDPPKTRSYMNASLKFLISSAEDTLPTETTKEAMEILDQIEELAKELQVHRNKRVSHRDSELVTGELLLPDIPLGSVNIMLDKIHSLLNIFSEKLQQTTYSRKATPASNGAQALVNHLKLNRAIAEKHPKLVETVQRDLILGTGNSPIKQDTKT